MLPMLSYHLAVSASSLFGRGPFSPKFISDLINDLGERLWLPLATTIPAAIVTPCSLPQKRPASCEILNRI